MNFKFLAIWMFLYSSSLVAGRSTPSSPTYKAGVVEFAPSQNPDPNQVLLENLNDHLRILDSPEAADLDIIVFAEYVLNYFPTAVFVPDPDRKVNPCTSNEFDDHDILKQLSCAARKGQKYVVINLIEKVQCSKENCPGNQKIIFYNTSIVFDRTGRMIARYRKYHLFDEGRLTTPDSPELITFDTDFGVTFGVLIFFDINFYSPALILARQRNVTDMVISFYWHSELPHGTGLFFSIFY
jgi:predicted amidohydrolase